MKSGLSQSKIAPREGPGVNCPFLDKHALFWTNCDKRRCDLRVNEYGPKQTRPGGETRILFPERLCSCRVTAYLSRKLTRPLVTKDGGTLRTVLDARAYMHRLSKDRERSARWQRAAQLLLAKADV